MAEERGTGGVRAEGRTARVFLLTTTQTKVIFTLVEQGIMCKAVTFYCYRVSALTILIKVNRGLALASGFLIPNG